MLIELVSQSYVVDCELWEVFQETAVLLHHVDTCSCRAERLHEQYPQGPEP